MTDDVEIPAADPGVSTMVRSTKVFPGDCNDERQPEMVIWPFWTPILPLPIVRLCRNHHLATTLLSSTSWSKFLNLSWNFDDICHSSIDIIIFDLAAISPFPLSFVVAISCWHFFELIRARKPQICHQNFSAACQGIRDKYFRFGWLYWYFRLSVVFKVTVFEISIIDSPRLAVEKKQIWRFSK